MNRWRAELILWLQQVRPALMFRPHSAGCGLVSCESSA